MLAFYAALTLPQSQWLLTLHIIPQLLGARSRGIVSLGPLSHVLKGRDQGVIWAVSESGGLTGEESTSPSFMCLGEFISWLSD